MGKPRNHRRGQVVLPLREVSVTHGCLATAQNECWVLFYHHRNLSFNVPCHSLQSMFTPAMPSSHLKGPGGGRAGITILLSQLGKLGRSPAVRWVAHSPVPPDGTLLPRMAACTETGPRQRAHEVSPRGRGAGEAVLGTSRTMRVGSGGGQIAKAFGLHRLSPAGPLSWAPVHHKDCHGRGGDRRSHRQEPPSPVRSHKVPLVAS